MIKKIFNDLKMHRTCYIERFDTYFMYLDKSMKVTKGRVIILTFRNCIQYQIASQQEYMGVIKKMLIKC